MYRPHGCIRNTSHWGGNASLNRDERPDLYSQPNRGLSQLLSLLGNHATVEYNKKETIVGNKKQSKEQFINKENQAYTVKITTILKIMLIAILIGLSFVGGWNQRSAFENEVRSEVRHQMSVIETANKLKD